MVAQATGKNGRERARLSSTVAGERNSRARYRRWGRAFGLLLTIALLGASCSTSRYVAQAVVGGARVLGARQPLERYSARPDLPPQRRDAVAVALAAREFAVEELGLPDNRSYRTIVDLGRPEATWVVTAAPEFSLEPETWCFPIAGCVSYRGYFSRQRAERFGSGLQEAGFDVVVRGASAYSTLGWFADPLFAAHLDLEPWRLAGLIFHELAHQVVYVAGDTAFNESYASAVERVGVDLWLAHNGNRVDEIESIAATRQLERRFIGLLMAQRPCFDSIYSSVDRDLGPEELVEARRAKDAEFRQLAELGRLEGLDAYRAWFEQPPNNARLAAISDYERWVPVFVEAAGEPVSALAVHELAETLAGMPPEERMTELERRLTSARETASETVVPRARCAVSSASAEQR